MNPSEGQFEKPTHELQKARPDWAFQNRYNDEEKREQTTRNLFEENPTVAELEKRAKAAEAASPAERMGLDHGAFEISGDALARIQNNKPPKSPAFDLRIDK